MSLSTEERQHIAKDALDNMSEKDIALWKERLSTKYKSFDCYCPDCGVIREMALDKQTLKVITDKHPLTGPKTMLSPQGSIICECKPCLIKRYPELAG